MKRLGIDEKIVDVISIRKSFDNIKEMAENIYKQKVLSFSEKIYLSHYTKGPARKNRFFGTTVPVHTHYQSILYKKLTALQLEKGLDDTEVKELHERWKEYPIYIIVGYNPYLEIRKVYNLSINKTNGREIIEWEQALPNGKIKRKKYERNKYE